MSYVPKGFEYWDIDQSGNIVLADDAPEWAKAEYEEYVQMMDHEPDDNGIIIMY